MSYNLNTITITTTLDDAQYNKCLINLEELSESIFQKIAESALKYLSVRNIFGFVNSTMQEFSASGQAGSDSTAVQYRAAIHLKPPSSSVPQCSASAPV